MKGFDPQFRDLPHYILAITREIWEERGLGPAIRRYYAPDSIVRHPFGVTRGAEEVVAETLQTLHLFPDRQLLGEDVIWAGDEDRGFYSSHRILTLATHAGDGVLGPATGRRVRYRVVGDCVVRANEVHEEWVIRDHGAIARAIGTDARGLAVLRLRQGLGEVFRPETDPSGHWRPIVEEEGPAARYGRVLARIWNEAATGLVRELYDRAATVELPGGRPASGFEAIDRWYVSRLASFPGARLGIDHLFARNDPGRPVRVAARWSVHGRHTGHGAFGPPIGRAIRFTGISHAELVDDRVVAEWVVVDEVAIWTQVLAGTIPCDAPAEVPNPDREGDEG